MSTSKKTLGILRRGPKKMHDGDLVQFWTSLWTDEDPDLIKSVRRTYGKTDADRMRNWMRKAFDAMRKVTEVKNGSEETERKNGDRAVSPGCKGIHALVAGEAYCPVCKAAEHQTEEER